jgi:hypothetical protein
MRICLMNDEVNGLISRYGLEEDIEHVIIPIHEKNGHVKRCYLLKREFMRLMYPEGHYVDYPLAEVIEATVRYPDIPLSEALYLLHGRRDDKKQQMEEDET